MKLIVELTEPIEDKDRELINLLFSELKKAYLTEAMRGSFELTDKVKVKWRYTK